MRQEIAQVRSLTRKAAWGECKTGEGKPSASPWQPCNRLLSSPGTLWVEEGARVWDAGDRLSVLTYVSLSQDVLLGASRKV